MQYLIFSFTIMLDPTSPGFGEKLFSSYFYCNSCWTHLSLNLLDFSEMLLAISNTNLKMLSHRSSKILIQFLVKFLLQFILWLHIRMFECNVSNSFSLITKHKSGCSHWIFLILTSWDKNMLLYLCFLFTSCKRG